MVEDLQAAVDGKRTEIAQKNAITRQLGSLPVVIQDRLQDGRIARIYVWRGARVALVAGPSVEGLVYGLQLHRVGEPLGSVYVPARGRLEALTSTDARRLNPSVRIGKKRADGDGPYIEWRPTLPSGSRPRVRLRPGDEVLDTLEAASEAIERRRAIEDRERGGSSKVRRKRRAKAAPRSTVTTERPSLVTSMYDSAGREYATTYAVISTGTDGSGPIVPSNDPGSLRPIPGYPPAFQARSLASRQETAKIRAIAENLDPQRLLVQHADPTLGPPVVWYDDQKGRYFVLGGNGRTLALLSSPPERFGAYTRAGRELYPDLWPTKRARPGKRAILVRVVADADGQPLTEGEAVALAAASQESTSAAESPIGKAIATLRSLGITSPEELPDFQGFTGLIGPDNVADFRAQNRAFTEAILARLEPSQRARVENDPAALAQLMQAIMVGFLPGAITEGGFVSEKDERILLGMMPLLVSIEAGIREGVVKPKWSLLPHLATARDYAYKVRNLSKGAALKSVQEAAQQTGIEGVTTIFDELTPLSILLGLMIKQGAATVDPAATIERYLLPYYNAALDDDPRQAGGAVMFGAQYGTSPEASLSSRLKVQLPPNLRRANPAPVEQIDDYQVWTLRRTNPAGNEDTPGQLALFSPPALTSLTATHFASGSNSPTEIRAFTDLQKAVGVAAASPTGKQGARRWKVQCSPACEAALIEATAAGVPVFVDSGAFSEVEFGPSGPYTALEITPAEWDKRLALYRRLIERSPAPHLVHVVAPDKIADQVTTLRRLRRYAPQVRELRRAGGSILVPLQKGALSLAEFHRAAERALGFGSWIPAIPMKKDATTPEDLGEYLAARRPAKIHLLGVGPRGPKAGRIAAAILDNSPDTAVNMDSVLIRAVVGRKGARRDTLFSTPEGQTWADLSERERAIYRRFSPKEADILQGRGDLPLPLTRAQDQIKVRLAEYRGQGTAPAEISEGYPVSDWTEDSASPGAWLTPAARQRIAEGLNFPPATRALWLSDPDAVVDAQIVPGDYRILPDDTDDPDAVTAGLDLAIEAALLIEWNKMQDRMEAPIKKRLALREVFALEGPTSQIRRDNGEQMGLSLASRPTNFDQTTPLESRRWMAEIARSGTGGLTLAEPLADGLDWLIAEGLITGTRCVEAADTVYGRATCTYRLTPLGDRRWMAILSERDQDLAARQTGLFGGGSPTPPIIPGGLFGRTRNPEETMKYPAVFRSHEYEDPELEDEDERDRIIEENARRAIWRVLYANQIPQVGNSADFVDDAYELGRIHGAPLVLIDDEIYGWSLILPLFMDDAGDVETWRGEPLTEGQQKRIGGFLVNHREDPHAMNEGETTFFQIADFGDAESIEDGIEFAEQMIEKYPRR